MGNGISAVDLADEYFLTQGKKEPLEIFCYQKGYEQSKENAIEEINKAEDKLVSCFKKSNEIWTIRFAFAELREDILKGDKNDTSENLSVGLRIKEQGRPRFGRR